MRVRDVMTTELATARPDTPFQELVDLMVRRDIGGLPVVDDGGRLCGVVTEADLVSKEAFGGHHRTALEVVADFVTGGETQWAARSRGVRAEQLMTRQLVTAHPDDRVQAATRRLLEAGVGRLLVVDGTGSLVGIVSRSDLLRMLHRSDSELRTALLDVFADPLCSPERAQVHVSVLSGEVTLTGTVEFPHDVPLVTALAWSVPGVVDVHNEVTARSPEPHLADV